MSDRYLYPLLLLCLLFILPCGLSLPRPAPTIPRTITGQVVDVTGPVSGAEVRFQGETAFVRSDGAGRFQLTRPAKPRNVAVWKDGYFIASAQVGAQPLHIKLKKLPAHDFDDYHWIDPSPDPAGTQNCANCHADIYQEWLGSGHARSATGRRFQSIYRDLLKEHPVGSAVCNSCHAPTLRFGEPAFADLTQVGGIAAQGVHCDLCHKIQEAGLGRIGHTHGYFGLKLLRPEHGQLFFGPLKDASRGEEVFSPHYRQSKYCASCHEGTVFGVHVYGTYSEWLESPASRQGKQCQDCHMTPTGRMTNMAPGHGGIERDPKTLASHGMFAGSQADMLRNSLKVKVETLKLGDTVNARVEVVVSGVGHRVPTGFIDRHLLLVVEGHGGGQMIPASSGPRLPPQAGKEFAGQAGKLYGRVLTGFDGQSPAPFWRASEDPTDTRLQPESIDTSRYSFPGEVGRLRVRLIYRRFWAQTAVAKGWPVEGIVVVDEVIPIK